MPRNCVRTYFYKKKRSYHNIRLKMDIVIENRSSHSVVWCMNLFAFLRKRDFFCVLINDFHTDMLDFAINSWKIL